MVRIPAHHPPLGLLLFLRALEASPFPGRARGCSCLARLLAPSPPRLSVPAGPAFGIQAQSTKVPDAMNTATPLPARRLVSLLVLGIAVLLLGIAATNAQDSSAATPPKIATMTPDELQKRLAAKDAKPLVVDVREQAEYDAVHIDGVLLAPLGNVVADLAKIDRSREIVLVCRSGRRSAKAYEALAAKGFTSLRNLEGGMIAWEKAGLPVVKKAE